MAVLPEKFRLSGRQLDVLQELCAGFKRDAIALHLGITKSTVADHCEHLHLKLGVHDHKDMLAHLVKILKHRR